MSATLDTAIGIVLLYLLLALIVSTVQELLASALEWRAKNLYAAIADMLQRGNAPPLVQDLYQHPLIRNLVQKGRPKLPSYIPSKTFAIALLDVLQSKAAVSAVIGADKALTQAQQMVTNLPAAFADLKQTLNLLIGDAQRYEQDLDKQAAKLSEGIEAWFNDRMARASGWYKRQAQYISLALAAVMTVACNADTLYVATRLWQDANLRAAVVASAQAVQNQAAVTLQSSPLPIGFATGWHGWLTPVGWIVTALAVSLGSTFWFDTLGKLLQVRGTGTRISVVDGKADE